ncbi:hypothetical protein, partial [Staphylococcus kloosii]
MSQWLVQLRSALLKKRYLIFIFCLSVIAIIILAFSSFGKTNISHYSNIEMKNQHDNLKKHTTI